MTPEDLHLVQQDARAIANDESLAEAFYACLFEHDPGLRQLFPDDMTVQQRKLADELTALVELGITFADGNGPAFVERAGRLGATHRDFGVRAAHYDQVGLALLQTLGTRIDGWDETHEKAWTRLYRLVAVTMLEGAG